VNTAVFVVSDTSIQIAETGRYEININGEKCIADVKRGSSLSRKPPAPADSASAEPAASAAPAPTPTPTPTPKATPPPASTVDCSSPGDPARLEVRPSKKLVRTGESFTFRATVMDAHGCPTTTPVKWTLGGASATASGVTLDATGKLTIADSATTTDLDIVATAAGQSAHATANVTTPAKYDELLAQSGLDPNGEVEEPAVAIIATGSIGGADAKVEDKGKRRKITFIAIVAGVSIALGVVAVVGMRRSRKAAALEREAGERHEQRMREFEARKRDREEKHAAQMRAHLESVARAQQAAAAAAARGVDSGPMVCPSCKREYPPGSTFCPQDANRLIAVTGNEEALEGPSGGICPTCHRGYNPGIKVCPADGDELLPHSLYATRAIPAAPAPRGKICPTCGDRFDGSAGFCGKDGTALVLLN
jgi:hypothetical protein